MKVPASVLQRFADMRDEKVLHLIAYHKKYLGIAEAEWEKRLKEREGKGNA